MAIDPSAQYPTQIDTGDAAYPYGKATNDTIPGDQTGTPLEKEWVNDLLGFQQAMLDAASITPSGNPDEVDASQYLEAIKVIKGHDVGLYYLTNAATAFSAKFTLAERAVYTHGSGSWTLGTNTVQVPRAGLYLVHYRAILTSNQTTNPMPITTGCYFGAGTGIMFGKATRFSASTSDYVAVGGTGLALITDPATETIYINSTTSTGTLSPSSQLYLDNPLLIVNLGLF